MNKIEIEGVLKRCMEKYSEPYDPPSDKDWAFFRNKFGTDFGTSFRNFYDLMSIYNFPGEIFNISSGRVNLNSSLYKIYDNEVNFSGWNKSMLPFYDIGNGDCFCLNLKYGNKSKVYYFDHEDDSFEEEYDDFEQWIYDLVEFLED